jgi:hypothetical protein
MEWWQGILGVLAVAGLVLMPLWTAKVRYYDCDLCGRHAACSAREMGKASAGHVCDQCWEMEREFSRRMQ